MAQVIVVLVQSPGASSYTNLYIIILKCVDMTLVCHKGSLDINQKVGVLMMKEYRNPNPGPIALHTENTSAWCSLYG